MSSEEPKLDSFFEFGKIRELKGLEYGGEESVKCASCDKELFVLMKISDKPTYIEHGFYGTAVVTHQYFVGNCPFCGDQSWKVRGEGRYMFRGSLGKTAVADIDMDTSTKELINKLTIIKDKSGDSGE